MTTPLHGRGAVSNPLHRFEALARVAEDDGWAREEETSLPETQVIQQRARTALTRNDSPDIPFDRSVNPYQGCEHGCVYCYARPSHAYHGFSPGLDFETRIIARPNIAERLRAELAKPGYRPGPVALGANTDPWQPEERKLRTTRKGARHNFYDVVRTVNAGHGGLPFFVPGNLRRLGGGRQALCLPKVPIPGNHRAISSPFRVGPG